eukprot:2682861-Alexandrium_andersonii.AAC.1
MGEAECEAVLRLERPASPESMLAANEGFNCVWWLPILLVNRVRLATSPVVAGKEATVTGERARVVHVGLFVPRQGVFRV